MLPQLLMKYKDYTARNVTRQPMHDIHIVAVLPHPHLARVCEDGVVAVWAYFGCGALGRSRDVAAQLAAQQQIHQATL